MGVTKREMAGEEGLWAVFRLEQDRYCLYGEDVDAIVIPEELTGLPGMPAYFAGLLKYDGSMAPVIDMRILFHMPSMEQRVEDFAQMKTVHTEWIESLRESVERQKAFKEPHGRIHQCGARVNALLEEGKDAYGPFEEADTIYKKEILPLLDRLIDAYREANSGVIFIVHAGGQRAGLLVDEAMELIKRKQTVPCKLPRAQPFLESAVLSGKTIQLCVDIGTLLFLGDGGFEQPGGGIS